MPSKWRWCIAVLSLGVVDWSEAQVENKEIPIATEFRFPLTPLDPSKQNPAGYYVANDLWESSNLGYHTGEDWNGNGGGSTDYGDPVYPMGVGRVVKVFLTPFRHSWGNTVIIKHRLVEGTIVYSLYSHLSEVLVEENQIIWPKRPLGRIGDGNGYYPNAAHLHFEVRRINDWTPTSAGYYRKISIELAKKYLAPSSFIDDRLGKLSFNLTGGESVTINDASQLIGYAPASMAYTVKAGEVKSLYSAVSLRWLDSRVTTSGSYFWLETGQVVFGPDISVRLRPFIDFQLTLIFPRNNFPQERARMDMIAFAERDGALELDSDTVIPKVWIVDSDAYDYRSMCFKFGNDLSKKCLMHLTLRSNPLDRWIIRYDPIEAEYLGDFVSINPNGDY